MLKPTVADMMAAYAEDAVNHAKEAFDISLDMSEDSLRHLESILAYMYEQSLQNSPPEDKYVLFSKTYGGYFGEVLRLQWGGEWGIENDALVLTIGKSKLFPPARVYWRLKKGDEENLWYYYQVLRGAMARG